MCTSCVAVDSHVTVDGIRRPGKRKSRSGRVTIALLSKNFPLQIRPRGNAKASYPPVIQIPMFMSSRYW
uniref:Transposase n=1 Tax=Panagrellus redivivus TaxID=6233 RepID=A0A7E4V947_PANRE